MMRLIILISLLTMVQIVKGQDGITYIFMRGGAVYQNAGQVSAGFDFPSKFHDAYEVSLLYYRSNFNYENYLLGLNYKPVLLRNKNTNLRFRFGAYAGTDLKRFIATPNVGLELIQSLSRNLAIALTNNNGHFFGAKDNQRWRAAVEIGIRLKL